MKARSSYGKVAPGVREAMLGLEKYVESSGLGPGLLSLIIESEGIAQMASTDAKSFNFSPSFAATSLNGDERSSYLVPCRIFGELLFARQRRCGYLLFRPRVTNHFPHQMPPLR
ncbi:MAG: hypothetical protein JRM97_08775 [Nitrososphaerota archaeon]|jgi:hypothetical protein|nr:hypothetical protein [Nitrososphaerota archaeon]MDG7032707.1 hypothetical protein [Nitrososphaerota archaeon]